MANLQFLLDSIFDHPSFRGAVQSLTARTPDATPVTLSGLTGPAMALVVAGLACKLRRPVVVVTSDNEAVDNLQRTTSTVCGWLEPQTAADVLTLPALDGSPYEGRSPHARILEQRAVTLWNIARSRVRVLYVPAAAALARFRDRAFYSSLAIELRTGDELDLGDLSEHLSSVGYEWGEPVSEVGQFSVRGGIVDVFPPESEWPFRIEFFGDQIESLREFDPGTQRSRKPVQAVSLLPLSEIKRSTQFFEKLVRALRSRVSPREPASRRAEETGPEWAGEYSNPFPGWEFFATLAEPCTNSLFSLLDNPVLFWDEPLDRRAQMERFRKDLAAGFDEVRDVVPPRPKPEDVCMSEDEFLRAICTIPQIGRKELSIVASPPEAPDQGREDGGPPAQAAPGIHKEFFRAELV